MNRRQFLAASSGIVPPVLAGCLNVPGTDSGTTADTDDGSGPPPDEHDRWHLCHEIAQEPSIPFETAHTKFGFGAFESELDSESRERLLVTLVTNAEETDRFDEERTRQQILELVNETDFSHEALLILEWGSGVSGSLRPRIERIEAVGDEIHAYGCVAQPFERTADDALHLFVARFDPPKDSLDRATVTLALEDDQTVEVDSADGIV